MDDRREPGYIRGSLRYKPGPSMRPHRLGALSLVGQRLGHEHRKLLQRWQRRIHVFYLPLFRSGHRASGIILALWPYRCCGMGVLLLPRPRNKRQDAAGNRTLLARAQASQRAPIIIQCLCRSMHYVLCRQQLLLFQIESNISSCLW